MRLTEMSVAARKAGRATDTALRLHTIEKRYLR